ncbi:carboxypeptidase-like regulatory domain-containing protein [Pedobacter fastidiosus]|uniref:TonB-dependent receptor n=1 Tax=Pedobacter fastidiosus TaxID=2765361 RepID=A0ABR7KWQ6_9SPHI|nr:TonB-dependent receptor [Pedobacter fastidiosus]MBC6112465.1 TonB-dependent receptor [Pedobacter fastidiosus]
MANRNQSCVKTIIICLSVCLWFHGNCFAQEDPLSKSITISLTGGTLSGAIEQLQKQSGLSIAFDPQIMPNITIKAQSFINQRMGKIVSVLIDGTALNFELIAGTIVITKGAKLSLTIHGIVQDAETGENLIGAILEINGEKQSSNQYGYFSISLAQGIYSLTVDYLGYNTYSTPIVLNQDSYLDVHLGKKTYQLEQISIHASSLSEDSLEMVRSVRRLSLKNTKKMPYFAGEVDVMKALQMQQGVKNPSEGSSALSVRGGDYDQNLILIDEAPIYNPTHLLGLVSVLNIDAVKNVELYPDYIPAMFGGRLSSVVDTRLEEGSLTDYHLKGGFSLLSARLATEGPLIKNKSSYLFAARRSLTDLFNAGYGFFNVNANYYDLNFKTNYILSIKDRVYLSLYHGFDHLFSQDNYSNNWTNTTMTFRWNHIYTPRLFMNFSAIYSNYRSDLSLNGNQSSNNEWLTGIRDVTLKADLAYNNGRGNHMQFGVIGTRHHLRPGETLVDDKTTSLNRVSALEYALYFDHDLEFSRFLQVRYGLRAGIFNQSSEIGTNIYGPSWSSYNLEPRAQLIVTIKKNRLLKFTYNRTVQHLQVLQNNEQAYSSIDTYISSGPTVAPQRSDFFFATFSYLGMHNSSFNLSAYTRNSHNQLDLVDHAQIILNPDYEQLIRVGRSSAYGLELSVHHNVCKGAVGLEYTYSRAFRTTAEINGGEKYPAGYDTPHDLRVSLSYPLSSRLVLSSLFNYRSGKATTLPVGFYLNNGIKVPIYEGRNNARLPDFSRLDIVLQLNPKNRTTPDKAKKVESTWNFGIYNVYDRRNPLFYRITTVEPAKNIGFEESFSGILPTFSYSFRF